MPFKKVLHSGELIKAIHDHQLYLDSIHTGAYAKFENRVMKGELIRGGNLSRSTFYRCTFVNCIFDRLTLAEASIRGCKFINCTFKNVDLFSAKLSGTSFDATTKFINTDTCSMGSLRMYIGGITVMVGNENTKINCVTNSNDYLLHADANAGNKHEGVGKPFWNHWHSLIKLAIMLKKLEPSKEDLK